MAKLKRLADPYKDLAYDEAGKGFINREGAVVSLEIDPKTKRRVQSPYTALGCNAFAHPLIHLYKGKPLAELNTALQSKGGGWGKIIAEYYELEQHKTFTVKDFIKAINERSLDGGLYFFDLRNEAGKKGYDPAKKYDFADGNRKPTKAEIGHGHVGFIYVAADKSVEQLHFSSLAPNGKGLFNNDDMPAFLNGSLYGKPADQADTSEITLYKMP